MASPQKVPSSERDFEAKACLFLFRSHGWGHRPHPMLCCAMLRYALLCYVMLRYATSCYVTLRYAMLCYVVLWYTMLPYGRFVSHIFARGTMHDAVRPSPE